MTETQQMVKEFLNKCGIIFEDYKMLDGMLIPRETLLNDELPFEIQFFVITTG